MKPVELPAASTTTVTAMTTRLAAVRWLVCQSFSRAFSRDPNQRMKPKPTTKMSEAAVHLAVAMLIAVGAGALLIVVLVTEAAALLVVVFAIAAQAGALAATPEVAVTAAGVLLAAMAAIAAAAHTAVVAAAVLAAMGTATAAAAAGLRRPATEWTIGLHG